MRPDSPPLNGSATRRGDMVGLDGSNRAIRGEAEITVADLTDPPADVTLTPRARAAMRWKSPPVTGGGFPERPRPGDGRSPGFSAFVPDERTYRWLEWKIPAATSSTPSRVKPP